ncbi:hypothetical protein [Candidatus Colwellia aromaticivorans]|uniref:hypothetical protein n=1 Tax=Candidatus Colwellia aromaticivorans TaxID=2267621 RepID=UPI000DF481E2|nr:hypothetical protein [Candidatus Colwellia aromaticivorans]
MIRRIFTSTLAVVALAVLLLQGCDQKTTTTAEHPLITEETVEAILAIKMDEESSQMRKEALTQLQTRVADLDPNALVNALDQLWLIDLRLEDDDYSTLPTVLLYRDILASLGGDDAVGGGVRATIGSRLRRAFLEWWYDAWLAQLGMEAIRSYIQSPFHYPPAEDRVRSVTKNQITAYHDSAKKKLIAKLKAEQTEAQAKADRLRATGGSATDIDRLDTQVTAYGWAINEVETSMAAP